MRKTVFNCSILCLFVISCSNPSQEHVLISDYVQTVDKVKTDMSFKVIESKELDSVITNRDSIAILLNSMYTREFLNQLPGERFSSSNYSKDDCDTLIDNLKSSYSSLISTVQDYEFKVDSIDVLLGENYMEVLADENTTLDQKLSISSNMTLKETFLKGLATFHEMKEERLEQVNKFERLNTVEERVLVRYIELRYQIKNPFLNNTQQEIEETFLLNGDKSKVLDSFR